MIVEVVVSFFLSIYSALTFILYDGRVFYIILHCLFVSFLFFLHGKARRGLNIYLKASFFFSIKKLMIASSLTWCAVLFSTVIMFYASIPFFVCLFVCFKRKQEVSTATTTRITMYIYFKAFFFYCIIKMIVSSLTVFFSNVVKSIFGPRRNNLRRRVRGLIRQTRPI